MKEFVKNHLSQIILTAIIFVFILMVSIGQNRLSKQKSEFAVLQSEYDRLWDDRENLKTNLDFLEKRNEKLSNDIDSIKTVQARDKKELQLIIERHKAEIDSLLDVPDDTVYVRLQPIYPNNGQQPLSYPFSGTQIRQIYSVAISYPRLQEEYSAQTKVLGDCGTLNDKYAASIENYKQQTENLAKNIDLCDAQIKTKEDQLFIAEKQNKSKSFWNWIYKGSLVVLGVVALTK